MRAAHTTVFIYFSLFFVYFACCKDTIPEDWKEKATRSGLLYTENEPDHKLMTTISNGYIGTVMDNDYVYIAGVFNGIGTKDPSHRAKVDVPINIRITNSTKYASAIDLECNAFYRRSYVGNDNAIKAEQKWFTIVPDSDSLELGDDPDDLHILVHILKINNPTQYEQKIYLESTTTPSPDFRWKKYPQNDTGIYIGETKKSELPGRSPKIQVAKVHSVIPKELTISPNTEIEKAFVYVLTSSIDKEASPPFINMEKENGNELVERAKRIYAKWYIDHPTFESSLIEQCQRWSTRAGMKSISVAGDDNLARAINSSIHYILASTTSRSMQASLSPGSLSTNGYNGHVFWDSAMWMYPAVQYISPRDAAQLLRYRIHRTYGAESKAKSYHSHYKGLMFPWESAYTGEEVCPESAPTGQLEQHISMDIVWAFRQYWLMSHDKNWLNKEAYHVIAGIADWIVSRSEPCMRNTEEQAPWARKESNAMHSLYYCINGVIPPDEYAVNVNNSAFTNAAAQLSLHFAVEAAKELGKPKEIWEHWENIANKFFIPYDSNLKIHPEFEGYHGQLIKQADVILMGYPLQHPVIPKSLLANDLLYYTPRTDPHGPAMTYAMEAVAFLQLGRHQEAEKSFVRSYKNIHPPFDVWTETPTSGAVNFITGAGGFIQAVYAGYGGIRILPGKLEITPHSPPGTATELSLGRVCYQGVAWEINITKEKAELKWNDNEDTSCKLPILADVVPKNPTECTLTDHHTHVTIRPGSSFSLLLDRSYSLSC